MLPYTEMILISRDKIFSVATSHRELDVEMNELSMENQEQSSLVGYQEVVGSYECHRRKVEVWQEVHRRSVDESELSRGCRRNNAIQVSSSSSLYPKQRVLLTHSSLHAVIQRDSHIEVLADPTTVWDTMKEIRVVGFNQDERYIEELKQMEGRNERTIIKLNKDFLYFLLEYERVWRHG
ncbi:hypothetical protein VNO78_00949 [Psophocarpus tetragonolobus]|uniref:Uncharacterized protein n=1 Tax=Psophocarpus tetragonolobus TaxID=3891 RepID=A0AAN9XU26_PSOTE